MMRRMSTHREAPIKRTNPSGETRWVARYTGPDGKRRSAGTFKLKRDAQTAIQKAYERADLEPAGHQTLAAYLPIWQRTYPRSERTDLTNRSRVRAVLTIDINGRPFGDWPLADIRRKHATLIVDHLLRDQTRSVGGVRGILRTLSALAEDAITDELMVGNPFKGVKLRENDRRAVKPRREPRVWTFDQMHQFAAHAGKHEPMIRMLADCGLRVGELLALRREQQDLKNGVFRVDGTAWNGRLIASSREKRHDRTGPIPPGCLELVRNMPVRIDSPWLFPTHGQRRQGKTGWDMPGGRMWIVENWRRMVWRPTCTAAGIDPTPHEFRHSWVTHLRAAGIDPADLADVAGHSVKVADSVYTHPLRQSYDQIRSVVG